MDLDPVGIIMAWLRNYGLAGLFAMALAERFLPVIPSYGLLLAIGISAGDGHWSLSSALLSTSAGSLLGCAAWFYSIRALGEARSLRLLNGTGMLFGLPPARLARWASSFRQNQTAVSFTIQLVPTLRLFAPAFAALFQSSASRFIAASTAGIMLWNGLFLCIGHAVALHAIDTTNITALALAALCALLCVEMILYWLARRVLGKRQADLTPDYGS